MAKRPRPVPAAAAPPVPVRLTVRIVLLVVLVGLAYANTLRAPFIFDDGPSIELNSSIRDLHELGRVLHPPAAEGWGVAGRPLVNLSLAINYAISGLSPWSYHLVNLLIHAAATLALFGVVRLALTGPVLRAQWAAVAPDVAFIVALLWALHPLQTESVTCVIQRTESLMGLLFLAALYAFARSAEAPTRPARTAWAVASVGACALGMATKEVMVTAPMVIWLYDRTFLSGSFRATGRNRAVYYGLVATWALLFHLLQDNPLRGGTADYAKVSSWDYLLTQCRAIVLYLKLTFWPAPLVLDYGTVVTRRLLDVLPQALLLVGLAAATIHALARRPVLGFIGAWFFIILSPSSSIVPLVTQTMAEHRMYLPVAAIIALGAGWLARRNPGLLLPAGGGLAALALVLTLQRNAQYRDPRAIWLANRAAWPENGRVHGGLAGAADKAEDFPAAVGYYEDYLDYRPDDVDMRLNYARDLMKVKRAADARGQFEKVLAFRPGNAEARTNYATCLLMLQQWDEGIRQFEFVLRQKPDSANDRFNLAEAQRKAGRIPAAVESYRAALALQPANAFMQSRYGDVLMQVRRPADAADAYRAAVAGDPKLYDAWMNLGGACLMLGHPADAVAAFEGALRARPGDPAAQANLKYARNPPDRQ